MRPERGVWEGTRAGAAWALLALAAVPLFAHQPGGEAAGLLSGLRHPASGADHVVAMLAVGIWGAQLGPPALWLLPVAFPMMMALGGAMGLVGLPLPGVEVGIAVSALVLGVMVLLEARPRLGVALVMVGVFALFHGHAHGTELPPGQDGLLYSVGFVAATGTLHACGIAIGLIHRWSWGRLTLKAAGALIAASGLYFLWRALA